MAKEEEDKQTTEAPAEAAENSKEPQGQNGNLRALAIKALIVLVLTGALGFGLGKFLNGPSKAQATQDTAQPQENQEAPAPDSSAKKQYKYSTFEKITGNLDEPRMARYIMVTIKLAMNSTDHPKAQILIDQEKPVLINWLRTYLAGCTLDDVRGRKNLNRIRREICDRFNELLWPGQRPIIREVLFSEFAIQ